MFFSSLHALLRVLVAGAVGYAALVVFLRLSGKRTLSKMNAFDLVVTVALGSTLATVILSKNVAIAEGLLAFAVLIGAQYLVALGSSRSGRVQRVVKSTPALVYYRGQFLPEALRRERLTETEVRAAVRAAGHGALEDVEAVVLETAGDLSVIGRLGDRAALEGVRGAEP